MAEVYLTVRPTSRAGSVKILDHSEPVNLSGEFIDQRIKGTLGITVLSSLRVPIDGRDCHLDVGSFQPGAAGGPKGLAVR